MNTRLGPMGAPPAEGGVTLEEVQLATRNHGLPLEALRYDLTPPGLHYVLVHYDIPSVDERAYSLQVRGAVSQPLSLSLPEIREMPSTTLTVTMECAGNGRARLSPRPISQPWINEAVGTARWTGVPLRRVLDLADVLPETVEILFSGADHGTEKGEEQDYQRSLPLADAKRGEMLLAYEMNGQPLPPQHGAPLRLIVPGWYGMSSVKWLTRIDAIREPFDGYQMRAYTLKQAADEPGERLTRILVRALMIPPGFPDFVTRSRVVDAGVVTVSGRAWAGATPVAKVELGVDGEWLEAKLDEPLGQFAWRGWHAEWHATRGEHVLSCRATDADGNAQPLEQPWNVGGFANNSVQQVPVTVR